MAKNEWISFTVDFRLSNNVQEIYMFKLNEGNYVVAMKWKRTMDRNPLFELCYVLFVLFRCLQFSLL
jgi:hypothetical protein